MNLETEYTTNEFVFVRARVMRHASTFKFINTDGDKISHMMASSLWVIGDQNIKTLNRIGKVR